MTNRQRFVFALLAPAVALAAAVVISSIVLAISGHNPLSAYADMAEYAQRDESVVSILNRAVPLYISALAVAIGFKMNLFNIGVEGQYRLATLLAAWVGAEIALPKVLHIPVILVVAMATGAVWSGVAGVLRVQRGVSEVISTIMLNSISIGLAAYLFRTYLKAPQRPGSSLESTAPLPSSARMPGFDLPWGDANTKVFGFIVIAVLLGVFFHLLVFRTRFGFDLRATGTNAAAAQASGVSTGRMILITMLLSGALAGLVGMPQLLGSTFKYDSAFQAGIGFTGIGVALLGRNHPVGMAVGALLFSFLDRSAQILDLQDIPREVVAIMQGVILLSAVIAYEVVRRVADQAELRAASRRVEEQSGPGPGLATAGAGGTR